MQDYKSLFLAVVICATLVNTQTDTHRQTVRVILLAQTAELKTIVLSKSHGHYG